MKARIGFIGVGEMGFPMAKRLINADHKLYVFDMVKEPLLTLQNAGAEIGGSAKEVAEKSEMVIVMVRTTAQAESALSGDRGVLAGAPRGSTILLMSTIDPFVVKKLAGLAKERGVDFLDAPVSGAKQGAEAGTLTVMVGGVEDVFRKCKPIFDVLGKNIFYLGDIGMGESAKLVNNLLLLVNMCAAYEAMALAIKAGVKMDVLFNLIKVSTGNSWVIEHWDMVTSWKDNYKPGGTLDLVYKDINLTLDLGENLKVPLYLSSLAKQLLRY